MSQFLKIDNPIKLTKNTNLSITAAGALVEAEINKQGLITLVMGAQYVLTDAITGRVIHPRKIVRLQRNLEITLLDGVRVQIEDFFAPQAGQKGVLRAQAEFVFSTGEERLQYWSIADFSASFNASAGESITLWSNDFEMSSVQWSAVVPNRSLWPESEALLAVPSLGAWGGLGGLFATGTGVLGASALAIANKPNASAAQTTESVAAGKRYAVEGTVGAGPVLSGNDLLVTLYDEKGKILGTDLVVEAGGQYRIELPPNFVGHFSVRVTSTATRADYRDEATNSATDLGVFILSAVSYSPGGKDITTHISPLTDLAARKLTAGDALKVGLEVADVQTINSVIAKGFLGVESGDITTQAIKFTVDVAGTELTTSDRYAQALKLLSAVAAAKGGNVEAAQAEVGSGITWQPGQTADKVLINGEAAKVAVDTIFAANTVAVAAGEAVIPLNTITPSQAVTITQTQLSRLSPQQVATLTPETIAALPTQALIELSGAQLSALTDTQVAALTPAQLGGLSEAQMVAMALAGNLDNVRPAQVAALPATTIDNLPAAVMAALLDSEVAALTNAQLKALTVAQQVAMVGAGNLDNLSPAQLLILAPENTAAVTALRDDSGTVTGLVPAGGVTNDTTLEIRGTLTSALKSGESVRIYDGNTFVGTAVVESGATAWVFIETRVLTHAQSLSYSARVANAAGLQSPAGSVYSASLDTAVVDATGLTISLAEASDSGTVGDGQTRITTPEITVGNLQGKSFVVGDVIQLITALNNTMVGSYQVMSTDLSAGGQWLGTKLTLPLSVLAEGVHSIAVRVVDHVGNASTGSTPFNLTVDTSPPVVSTLGISSATGVFNKTLNADDIAHIALNLSEAVSVTGLPQLTLIIGSTEVQAQYNASMSSSTRLVFDYKVVLADNDSTGIAIKANSLILNGGSITDLANNSATLDHVGVPGNTNFLVNSNGPTLTLNVVAGDNQVNASEKAASITLSGLTSAEDNQTVTVLWGGVSKSTQVSSGAWQVNFAPADVPTDTTTSAIAVSVSDLAGNLTQISRNVLIDTSVPTIAFNANLTQGAGVAGDADNLLNALELAQIKSTGEWLVEGTSIGAQDGQSVSVTLNGQSYSGTVSANTWQISVAKAAVEVLVHGNNYTLTATVSDTAGNPATPASATLQLRLAPPDIPTINLVNTNSVTPTLSGAIQKESTPGTFTYIALETGDMFTVTVAGQAYSFTVGSGVVSANNPLTYSTSTKAWGLVLPSGVISAEGVYDVSVSVNAAGYATPKLDISSNELVIKTTPPVLSINTVALDDRLNALEHGSSVTLSGTAQDLVPGGTSNTAIGRSLSVNLNGRGYTATIQADGSWRTTVSATDIQALTDGNTDADISFAGFYGNTATARKTFVVDTQGPSLSLTTPADILLSTAELAAFSLAYTSTDTLGTTVVSAQIVNALNVVQTGVSLSSSSATSLITGDLSSLSDGVYTLQVSSSDAAGNVTLRSQGVTIDTIAPTAIIAIAGTALKAGETSLVTITFSEAVTGFSNADLTVPNGALSTVASVDGGVTWTATFTPTSNVEDTSNAITLATSYTDAAGNAGTAASSANFIIDTSAPVAPVFNLVATDDTINGTEQTPTLTGTNEVGATVALSIGGNTRVATVSGTTWSYTLTAAEITAMGQGAEALSATQTDAVGNVGAAGVKTIFVDTISPAVPVFNAVATDDIIGPAEQTTTLTGTNEIGATVVVNIAGNNREAVVSGGTWSYTLVPADITAMGEGAETLSATQTDTAGNVSAAGTKVITVATLVSGAPQFNPVATDNVINALEQNTTLTGTNVVGATVSLGIGGNTRTAVVSGGTWSYTLVPADITAMGQGFETLSATQTDALGNVSASSMKSIIVDTTAPARPGILLVATDDVINASEQTAAITGSNTSGATVALSIGGNSRAAVVSGTTWRYTLDAADITAMGEGAETVSATQSDPAGNVSTADTRQITVDTSLPASPVFNPVATDNIISASEQTTTTLTGTNESGATVALSIGGTTRAAAVNGTSWSYTLASSDITAMGHGAETLSARQTDAAGNVSLVGTHMISLNDAPTLTSVTVLTGFIEDTFKDITFANLLAAANEADLNGDTISFRVEAISSGTLEKRNASNTAWEAVIPGVTTLASGEKFQWKAAQDANGGGLSAFTVKAFDGIEYSTTAVQVSASVAAVNDVPTFTSVTALTGFVEDTFKDIGYADLLAASNLVNVDGDVISFRVETISSGTLEKRNASDTAWVAVVAGTTMLAAGEKFQWKGAQNDNNLLNLFTVKAFDGTVYSATAVQVSATVAVVNDLPELSTGTLTGISVAEDSHNVTAVSLNLSAVTYGVGGGSDESSSQTLAFAITAIPAYMTLWLANGTTQVTTASTGLTQTDIQGLKYKTVGDAAGTGNLTWTVTDSGTPAQSLNQSLSVTVTPVNDAPTALDATITLNEDDSKVFAATDFGFADALDNPGNTLSSVIISTLPTAGTLKLNNVLVTLNQSITAADIAAGLLTYTPAANGSGTAYASIGFKVQDNGGVVNSGVDTSVAKTLTMNVTALNDAPTAQDATITVLEEGSKVFAVSDFGFADALDNPANTLSAVIISTLPALGTLTLNGAAITLNQSITAADILAGLLVYTPAANGSGTAYASIGFKLQDNGLTANSGVDTSVAKTLTINVTPVNDAPTALDATITINEDGSKVFAAADFGFADALDNPANTLSAVIISTLPTAGTLKLNNVLVTLNQSITAANILAGSLVYTPTANGSGTAYASIGFKVKDDGLTANSGVDTSVAKTLTINVTPVNDAPTALDATITINEDGSKVFAAADFGFADALDSTANTLSAVIISTLPALGALKLNNVLVTLNQSITAADIAAGLLTYTPAANGSGMAFASIGFKVQDNGLTANSGVDTSVAKTLTINVTPVNDAPTAQDATITVLEEGSKVFAVSDFGFADALDTPANTLSAVIVSTLPALGTLTLNGVAVTLNQSITAADIALGLLTYTPAANGSGTAYASIGFKVKDNGLTANSGVDTSVAKTLSIDVTAVNDAPVLSAGTLQAVSVMEDAHNVNAVSLGLSTLTYGAGGGSDEANQTLSYVITSIPAYMTLWLANGTTQVTTAITGLMQTDIQGLKYKTVGDAAGTGNLTWTVTDSGTPAQVLSQSLSVTVTPVNDAPTALNATITLNEDDSKVFAAADFGFADALDNPANTLSAVIISTLPALGTLTLNGVAVTLNQSITAADIAAGLLTYTPAANGSGTAYSSIGFKVQDNGGVVSSGLDTSLAKTLTINVTAVNDAPVLSAGTLLAVSVAEDAHSVTAVSLGLSAVTYGVGGGSDESSQTLAFAITAIPAYMTLWLVDGTTQVTTASTGLTQTDIQGLKYKTVGDAAGTGNLTWTVTDSGTPAQSLNQSLSVTVTPVNDAPTTLDATITLNEDDSKVFAATDFGFADALDNPANTLSSVIISTLPALGSLRRNGVAVTLNQSITAADIAAGLLTYTPAANGSGTAYASIGFKVQDNGGVVNSGVDTSVAKTLTMNVLVDTFIADVTSATLDLKDSSDHGTSDTDNLTNVQLPTVTVSNLSGKAFQVGDLIEVLKIGTANTVVGSYSVLSSDLTGGIWNRTTQDITLTTSLAAGNHSLKVKTLDAAGNSSINTNALSITVDTVAPTLLRLPAAAATANVFDVQWTSSIALNSKPGQVSFASNLGDFTVSSWIRYDKGLNTGSWQSVFGSSNLANGILAVDNNNEIILGGTYLGGSLTSNAWAHVAVSVSTSSATLYVNGVLKGSKSITLASGNSAIYLGNKGTANNVNEIFSGDYSQFKVYDRVLNATEVSAAMSSTSSTDAALVAYFDPQSLAVGATSSVNNKVSGGPALSLNSVSVIASSTFNGPLLSRLDLQAASDTGTSTTDNITTDDTPTIDILNVNGLQVVVGDRFQLIDASNNNAVLATKVAATSDLSFGAWNSGNFSLTATPLSLSVHNLKVILVDAAGNQVTGGDVLSVDIRAIAPPVTLDLNGDGHINYTSATLDINLDGQLDRSGWVGAEDGMLFHNKFGDDSLRETGQYQFAQTKGQTDLQGLAEAFDTNQDGWFSAQDARFSEFSAWSDKNQDGKVGADELLGLQDLGIERIHLVHETSGTNGTDQVTVHGNTSANLSNGTKMLVQDASFLYQHIVI